jgi:hypothetical protein
VRSGCTLGAAVVCSGTDLRVATSADETGDSASASPTHTPALVGVDATDEELHRLPPAAQAAAACAPCFFSRLFSRCRTPPGFRAAFPSLPFPPPERHHGQALSVTQRALSVTTARL